MKKEILIIRERVNTVDSELKAYDQFENRFKRIDFLVSVRKSVDKFESFKKDDKLNMNLLKFKPKKKNHNKNINNSVSSFQTVDEVVPSYKYEHDKDVKNVKRLSSQFSIIDKLISLLYISTYTDKRQLGTLLEAKKDFPGPL